MSRSRGRLNPRFQQRGAAVPVTGVPDSLLKAARQSGQLNLSNRSLETVPSSVWHLNTAGSDADVSFDSDERWWDQTDLVKLILSANQISQLSEDLGLLPALLLLDVHDNRLVSLPQATGSLEHLTKLVVSHNKLRELPASIGQLSNLKQLRAEHNQLTSLPGEVVQLAGLEELDVSNNSLTLLPGDLGAMKTLRTLTASHNQLTAVPSSISHLTKLKSLTLDHNQLTGLPPMLECGCLEIAELQYNRLTDLPLMPSTLVQLHLGSNNLSALSPDRLCGLSSIVLLSLRDNRLSEVPAEIAGLETLERLDLSNNSLSTLPNAVGLMPRLKSLGLDGNTLRGLRRDIVNRGTSEVLKYLRSRIPSADSAGHPGHVTSKHTPSKQPSSGRVTPPPAASEAGVLGLSADKKRVDLTGKSLSQLPGEVLEHVQITELVLASNKLLSLPCEVGRLSALKVLDLRANQLSSLPADLVACSRLEDVVLSGNRFSELPPVLYQLPRLETIIASDNRISAIDVEALRQISGLTTLDLQNNSIAQVPPQLGTLTTLRHLQLGGNPFRVPRAAILARGTQALLDYLRDRIPA